MVSEKVKSIVDKMQGMNYHLCNWAAFNTTNADDTNTGDKYPACVYVLPISGSINISTGQIKDAPDCLLSFLDKAEMESAGEAMADIVERCKMYLFQFIALCNDSELFEYIPYVTYQVVYHDFDDHVSGVIATLKLQEIDGINECNLL